MGARTRQRKCAQCWASRQGVQGGPKTGFWAGGMYWPSRASTRRWHTLIEEIWADERRTGLHNVSHARIEVRMGEERSGERMDERAAKASQITT